MARRGPKPAKHVALAKAALALFVERGLKDATTRAIAKRARTTEASLYRHFPGKDGLARHVLRNCLSEFESRLERSQEGVMGARARLRAYVRACAEFGRDCPFEHSFLQQAHSQNLFARLGEYPRVRRQLSRILADGQATGEFLEVDPRWLAAFLAGGLGRVNQAAWRKGPGSPLDQPVEAICDAVEEMVASATSADLEVVGRAVTIANGESHLCVVPKSAGLGGETS